MAGVLAREVPDPATTCRDAGHATLVVDDDFVRTHTPFVERLARRFGVRPCDVPDLTQEVFLAALRRADTFEAGRSPRAWLFGITRLSAFKSHGRARELAFSDPPEVPVPPEQEDTFDRERARTLVHGALDALPEAQRDVVILHKLEGWPMPMVAEAVGCSVPTAQSRYRLGRARIERVIRGRVVRAQLAAAVAAVTAFFGLHAPTAAAATVALCVLGGGAALVAAVPASYVTDAAGALSGQGSLEDVAHIAAAIPASPTVSVSQAVPLSATSSLRPADTPSPDRPLREWSPPTSVRAFPAAAPALGLRATPSAATDASAAAAREAVWDGAAANAAPTQDAAPHLPRTDVAPAMGGAVVESVTEPPPAHAIEMWAEEGRLLRRARQLAADDPDAARAVLTEYARRFPDGRMTREAAQLTVALSR